MLSRDKATAREMQEQLNKYLTSIDKADEAVLNWQIKVAEIHKEIKLLQKSTHNRE